MHNRRYGMHNRRYAATINYNKYNIETVVYLRFQDWKTTSDATEMLRVMCCTSIIC